MSLILCGLPGSGKTTLGILLAEHLSLQFIDTDRLIEKTYDSKGTSLSCREIFLNNGENFFRELESGVISRLAGILPAVISVGGGAFLDRGNSLYLRSLARIVYLKGDWNFFYRKVVKNGIPAYLDRNDPKSSFFALAAKRGPSYEEFSDYVLEIDGKTKQELVTELAQIHFLQYKNQVEKKG
jgi:shikimate kinase